MLVKLVFKLPKQSALFLCPQVSSLCSQVLSLHPQTLSSNPGLSSSCSQPLDTPSQKVVALANERTLFLTPYKTPGATVEQPRFLSPITSNESGK